MCWGILYKTSRANGNRWWCCCCCWWSWCGGDVCVVVVGRWRGSKKLPVFGLFFLVYLAARPPSNRQTERQLGTEVRSKQQPRKHNERAQIWRRRNLMFLLFSRVNRVDTNAPADIQPRCSKRTFKSLYHLCIMHQYDRFTRHSSFLSIKIDSHILLHYPQFSY